ncbi:sorbitol/mannitol transport system substrate-binding protein [Kineococcus radiotolerans]|uniref:Sorbitol/mannitol transport system substrate-binding protein n=1 Tax=Kineococcus radiotolerans TaxID=131568 RepID=A0A7W4TLE2_KINRA|nr:sugar ABC transporter substrate-binding protein [Kineococcus radiotolerans]MBB2901064.1 sorbitol/mannitol transport system substrate-binding protein [Kineococcus radiotolerans]
MAERQGPRTGTTTHGTSASPLSRRAALGGAAGVGATAALSACAGAGGGGGTGSGGGEGGGDDKTLNVIMVNNPQMVDLQKLTADNFTKDTGITVKYTVLPENDVRDKISQEFSSQAGQYDVASISNYEVPFYSKNGWLAPLDEFISADSAFGQDDILKPLATALTGEDGKVYAEPFYGESSFLMYRKDVFEAKGLTMPEKPTWQEVADFAAQLDGAQPGMKGIALRGQPGWGQVFAPLTTVVNTFGGTWFDEDWTAQVNAPEFVAATKFYVDLVRAHGENGAPQAGFTECLNGMTQSQVAMWYDATSAAGSLDAADSPVAGKIGYVAAPVDQTESSGWLYTWAWGVQKASKRQENAWKFISWASSKEYEELVGAQVGWASVPAGKRNSTYENADYQASAGPFYKATQDAINAANPADPGVQPRPAPGIQFVAIPEFADLGTQVSQFVSSAIAGQMSVEDALDQGQDLATKLVSDKYKK